MPKKQALISFEDIVTESWLEDARKVAERVASEEGPPPGAGKMSDAKAVELYGQMDPKADWDTIYEALKTTGLAPEQWEQLQLSRERPELAPFYAEPAPDEQWAAWLATMAEYPWRPALVLDYSDEPEEQNRRDEQLYRMWQKQIAEQDAEMMAPAAAEPAPQTPTAPPSAPLPMPSTPPVAPAIGSSVALPMGG